MKFLILFVFLFSVYLGAYTPEIGVKFFYPLEIKSLHAVSKCIGVESKADYKSGFEVTLINNFEILKGFDFYVSGAYRYDVVDLEYLKKDDPKDPGSPYILKYRYDKLNILKLNFGMKNHFTDYLYFRAGFNYDYFLGKDIEINNLKLSLDFASGYSLDKFSVEISSEFLKNFNVEGESSAYIDLGIAFLYSF